MDISKLKEFIKKLGFIKSFNSLLLPLIITIIAAAVFVPTQMIGSRLIKQMNDESIGRGRKIQSSTKAVVARDQWKVEAEYQKKYQADANQIDSFFEQTSKRELLSYKIFPKPKDTSILIFEEFGRNYRSGIENLLSHIKAGRSPSNVELEKSTLTDLGDSLQSRGIALSQAESTIKEVLCKAKAKSFCVYINPSDISGYNFWGKSKEDGVKGIGVKEDYYEYAGIDQSVADCWYWQLGYWIIKDVMATVESMNSKSKNVFTSPVKRIMSVDFTRGGDQQLSSTNAFGGRPYYVTSTSNMLTNSYTGRVCNKEEDIVHFRLAVLINVKDVLPFMQELCSKKEHTYRGDDGQQQQQTFKHNQITILESDISSVNRRDDTHELFRYGDDAVVKLDLICEYIFNSKGYDKLKPDSVKNDTDKEKGQEQEN